MTPKDCPVCLLPLPCDPEIHAATLRIRAWLRDRLATAGIEMPARAA